MQITNYRSLIIKGMQPGSQVKLYLGVIKEKEICYLQNYKNNPKQIQELI